MDVAEVLALGTEPARHARAKVPARTGRYRHAVPLAPGEPVADLALDATLRQAVLRRVRLGQAAPALGTVRREDLRRKQRYRPCEHLIILVVDASDSMGEGPEARMRAAKGAALALLRRAYEDRSRVAVVAFGGERATVVLPPTNSVSLARDRLAQLPTGGATPLADGLLKAWRLVQQARRKQPGVRPVLVIVSDGEANVPLTPGLSPIAEATQLARSLRQDRIRCVFIDVVPQPLRLVERQCLARALGAAYLRIHALRARHLLEVVRGLEWNKQEN